MCNCINKITESIKETSKFREAKKITVSNVEYQIRDLKNISFSTSSCIEGISKKGKAIKEKIFHNYCPFCGEKYE